MRSSISWRKWRIRPWTGQAAASPSAQMCDPRPGLRYLQKQCRSRPDPPGFTLHHPLQHPPHPAGALAARRALAAALVLVEVADAGAIAFTRSVDLSMTMTAAGAEAGAQVAQRVEVHQRVHRSLGRHHSAPTSPPGMTAFRLPQPPRMPPQWSSISSRNADADMRLFHIARLVHVAGDAEQLRAGGHCSAAEPGEPVGAAAQDGAAQPRWTRRCSRWSGSHRGPRPPGTAASGAAGPSCPRGFPAARFPRRRYRRRRRGGRRVEIPAVDLLPLPISLAS